jgi:uncharacterized protein
MMLQWICLILFLLYYSFEVIWNLLFYQKIIDAINDGRIKRAQLYARLIAGLWIPALLVLLLAAFGSFTPNDIGLLRRDFSCPRWLFIASCAMAALYCLYLLISFTSLRKRYKDGADNSRGIPARMKAMLPVSAEEKRVWVVVAILVGIAEELLFRGFLFYLLLALFPALPIAVVLIASSVLFGLGHLYQGAAEAIKPALIGLLFSLFYIAFGTLLPCMLLHAAQDLCAVYAMPKKPA